MAADRVAAAPCILIYEVRRHGSDHDDTNIILKPR
jgi:hypothetical protein